MSFLTRALLLVAFGPMATQQAPVTFAAAETQIVQAGESLPVPSPSIPEKTDPICGVDETTRNDICAQWRAADAASNAVNIGWWQFYLGVFGGVVSLVTLVAAIGAAIYARHAAQAARDANQLARDSDRPWIFADVVLLPGGVSFSTGAKSMGLSTRVTLKNEGSTIAKDAHMRWEIFQTVSVDFDAEYKRILDRPAVQNPRYLAPFRDETIEDLHHSVTVDPRDLNGIVIVALIVYYRSPNSDKQLHTCVFFQVLNNSIGTATLTKNGSATKMV